MASKTNKKAKAGPGRPKDHERAAKAEQAKVLITMLPGMITTSLMNCWRRGDEAAAEKSIKEFVYAAKRGDARRIAREIVDLFEKWPVLRGEPGVTQKTVQKTAAGLAPRKREALAEAWKRIALGLNELESMLKPSKLAAFAYRQVADVDGASGDSHCFAETARRSKIDVVKHAAHELDERWKDVRQDRDGELGGPPKSRKKTKKKK